MYKELFDEEKQNKMRNFFINDFAPLGNVYNYSKNEVININEDSFVAVVTRGRVKHSLYDTNGGEKLLYFLKSGEIFGEVDYFTGSKLSLIVKTMEPTTISVVPGNILDEFLISKPMAYRYFIHSISRKYRISIFQISDMLFSSSNPRIADTIYRLALQDLTYVDGNYIINTAMTHQDLANLIGCSRVTVTRTLKRLKTEGVIDVKNKKIIIKDLDKLKSHIETF